jgi:predicted NBD/HSP70 family sugar kinase
MKQMAANLVVAVDLGGTKLAVAAVDRRGRVLRRQSTSVDASSSLAPVNQIVELTRELVGWKGTKQKASAVGVAVPGLVRRDGTVWAPNLRGWRKMALAQRLKKALRVNAAIREKGPLSLLCSGSQPQPPLMRMKHLSLTKTPCGVRTGPP